ncbi:MAG: carboxypeptidase regulatory-like domain-containing protein [Acidobacteria bacterium]|nr:carboxypeptidase regulatory-like domain-containing protein [Acidobacteriota bacterium]
MIKKVLLSLFLVMGLVAVMPALAQQTGAISGTVVDPSGAVIPSAEVTVTNERTGLKRVGLTNDVGFYTFPELPYGLYTVSVSMSGFKTASRTGIDLHVAEEKTVPIKMEIGQQSEVVTVTGGATEVNLRTGEVSNLIDGQQMVELPLNGRSFVQLTLLVPGANIGDNAKPGFTGLLGGVDISMSGSPANANAWLVDSADNVDHGSGRTILVYPSVDAIEEFKVQRNSYGAENNAAGGAQINLVTRGGTNAFHGSAYWFGRNDIFNANNFFLNRAGVTDKPKLRYNNFGYTIGGPVAKDKLFFFWSQEWRR